MYLGIVLFGLFNGLVLLPTLLYRWGPTTSCETEGGSGTIGKSLLASQSSES
jgi:hypothetical protein